MKSTIWDKQKLQINTVLRLISCTCALTFYDWLITTTFSTNSAYRKCERNIREAVEQEEKLCDEVNTVREFTHPVDRVSAGVGCEVVVTARTRC